MRCNDRPAAARPVAARPLVLLAVFLAAVIVPASAQIANPRLRVSTSTGTILGSICPEGRINTFRFLGIPYAQAPTGANRFAPPRALANSTAEVNANRRVACIQELPPPGTNPDGNITFTEDCLTLNIWSPGPITPRVPVRVFLHSNDLERGSANNQAYDGCVSSTDANIITITINYRLGALGFLSLPGLVGPNNSTGNWGVLDQQLALRWITDNIGAFGGDPSRITLHSHGAGATMALVHMVAPSSVGPNRLPTLFSGVILQSPKPTYYNSLSDAQTVGGEYMYRTGCNNLQCLRDLDTTAIVAAQLEMVRPFGPTIDGVVLSEAPYALASRGQITRVPILVLTSMEEANLDVIQQQGSRPMNAETSRDIVLELTNPPLQFRNRIASVYSTSNSETNNWGSDWFRATAMAVTEGVYHCGTRTLIDFVSALGAEVYVGMVSIPRSGQTTCAFQLLGLPADAARPLLPRLGYTNGYDLPLTFLAPFANLPAGCAYSDAERQTSAFIASSVAAFLENRHPIPRSSRGNLTVAPTMAAQREWPRYHPNGGIPGDRASVLIVNAERTFASIWPEDATSRCEVWDAVHVDMDNNGRYGEYPTVRDFIESRAGDQGDLSLLLAAVQNTELWDELYEVEGTFFLPTNEAVQTLLSETGLTPEQLLNLDELEDILLYHTLNFTLDVARANPPRRRIFTRNGAPVYLQKTGEGAGLEVRLIDRDLAPSRVLPSARSIIAGRSYVNLVDRVMTPFCTEFAPEEGIARRRLNRRH